MIAMLRQLSTRDQNDTEINNYRLPYGLQQRAKPIPHTQLQKAPKWQCKTMQTRKLAALFMYKKWTKNKYVTHKQTTTTELQAPYLNVHNILNVYSYWNW